MINTHRDDLMRGLSLFCRPGTFVDVKVGYQAYLLPPIHFVLQLLLGLQALGRLEDPNLLLSKLRSMPIDNLLMPKLPFSAAGTAC